MGKHRIKKLLKKIEALKIWQLVILLIMSLFVIATALRLNNVEMIKRREAVISADKELNLEKAIERLKELRDFTSKHMNTSTTVQLEKIYLDETEKIKQQMNEQASKNYGVEITAKARAVCDPRFQSIGYGVQYSQCFADELAKYNRDNAKIDDKIKFPEASLYINRFSSPFWTPDLMGWTVVVAILIIILIIFKIITVLILKIILKKYDPFI